MSTPDLPMRERIAEALAEAEASYRQGGWEEHLADAVLTVLADLPDTAVEAGAKAIFEEERNASTSGVPWPEWNDLDDDGKEPYRVLSRAVLTAVIAAIKEGKA